jgi:murein DD-endopeptidase MepM/ murein hydrolase activator NlpD
MKDLLGKIKNVVTSILDVFFEVMRILVVIVKKSIPILIIFVEVIIDMVKKLSFKLFGFNSKSRSKSKKKVFDVDDLAIDNEYFRESRVRMRTIFVVMFLVLLVMFFYFRSSVEERIEYEEEIEQIEPVTINVPHPNDEMNIDDYESIDYKVKSGDNFASILVGLEIDDQQIADALTVLKKVYNLRRLKVGQRINIKYRSRFKETGDEEKGVEEYRILDEIVVTISPEKNLIVTRGDDDKFKIQEVDKELVKYLIKYKGEISTSLYVDAIDMGVPANVMMEMIRLYSFDVDFQRDIRKGDMFEVLFETFYNEDGEKIKDGNILYSILNLRGEDIPMYRYKAKKDSRALYFDENGRSVQKSLLRTPINGARLSSRYGMRRHPILGYNKVHSGVDFAARTGTPFFASGDGVIVMKKWFGGFGNYIRIRHNSEYSSEYAHISRFKKGFGVGSRVKQGQVIAYVGNTGRSTGPHLHYGILYRGKRMNPNRVKSTPNKKLAGSDLEAFKISMENIERYRKNTPLQNNNFIR